MTRIAVREKLKFFPQITLHRRLEHTRRHSRRGIFGFLMVLTELVRTNPDLIT